MFCSLLIISQNYLFSKLYSRNTIYVIQFGPDQTRRFFGPDVLLVAFLNTVYLDQLTPDESNLHRCIVRTGL